MKLSVGSCFSGIGGLELGLEWTGGFETKWQIENDPYATRVLEKHWPHVKRYGDIEKVGWETIEPVDIIVGGFPCQDVSVANTNGTGLEGKRSGLWRELLRAIRVVRPKYALVENVPNLLLDGMGTVLGDLAESGYDSEWDCLSSHNVGAEHRRVRVFIVAYAPSIGRDAPTVFGGAIESCQNKPPKTGKFPWIVSRGDVSGRLWAFPNTGTFRIPDGLPNWVHRLRGLGNSVDVRRAKKIGEMILNHENDH